MPGIGQPPRRSVGAEDISNLQFGPGHPGVRSLQTSLHRLILQFGQHLVGADSIADRLGRDVCVSCCGRQLGVAEQHLDHLHIHCPAGACKACCREGVFASKRWVAKLCRNVCNVAGFLTPGICLAEVKARLN